MAREDLSIEHLMGLTTDDLLELAIEQEVLTTLEIELCQRLEQYLAMHGDYLKETQH